MKPHKSLLDVVPINRKEKYYTATVLPMIVCKDGIKSVSNIFELAKFDVGDIFAKVDYEDIIFYTEYNLKDSCVGCLDGSFGNSLDGVGRFSVPDVLVGVKAKKKIYLLAVEAKMFQKTSFQELENQLKTQMDTTITPFAKCLERYCGPSVKVVVKQCALLPEQMIEFNSRRCLEKPGFETISWQDILSIYSKNVSSYFYRMLQKALQEYDSKVSRKSLDITVSKMSGNEFFVKFNEEAFPYQFAGIGGGINGKRFKDLLRDGSWKDLKFSFSNERSSHWNWSEAKKFISKIKKYVYR